MNLLEQFTQYLILDCGLAKNTALSYFKDIETFPVPLTKSPQNLTKDIILEGLEKLKKQNLTNKTLSRKVSAIKKFFEFLIKNKIIEDNLNIELESPKIEKTIPKTLTTEEVTKLLEIEKPLKDQIMIRFLYASGLRVSELITLKINDIDLKSGSIRILGKGDKIRIVPIDTETCSYLNYYLENIRPKLLQKKTLKTQSQTDTFFLSNQGKPYTRQGFWKLLKKHAKLAGISEHQVSPHIIRHAFATHLLENGMNLRTLQTLLGHSDIATTEIYSHITKKHLVDAIQKYHPRRKIK
jgi:integrase/recombinase XerD